MASGTIKYLDKVTDLPITATAGSGVTIRRFNFHRMGRIVFGEIYFDVTSALSNNAVVVTIDGSLPRPYDLYATAVARNVSGSFGMLSIGRVDGSDSIKAWGTIPVGTYNYANFVYVAL